ncbi:MAG: ATP-binding protein, partial [Fusobacteriota bacterium]
RNTKEVDGTGIGLSVVKKLIKILGGGITIESELGKGTKVVVVLPFEKIKNKGE